MVVWHEFMQHIPNSDGNVPLFSDGIAHVIQYNLLHLQEPLPNLD